MMKYDLSKFKGIFVAMYACYDDSGEIDAKTVKKLARFYADKKVKGLYVCGSTGEGFLLNVEERKRTIEAVMEEVGDELTVIDHVGAVSTRDSIDLAVHAQSVGVDAVSAVPCVYYRIPESCIREHWLSIIGSTGLPFIIYNIPQTTGYELSTGLLRTMAENEKVIGVKNSSFYPYQTQQFKRFGGEDFIVFNGADEQYLAGRIMGAEAGIGGSYGVMPELFLEMEKYFAQGNLAEAQKWQNRVSNIIADMFALSSFYGASKRIVQMQGLDIGRPRPPVGDISEDEVSKVARIYKIIKEYAEETGQYTDRRKV